MVVQVSEREKKGREKIIKYEVESDLFDLQIKHKIYQIIYAAGGNSGANQCPTGH